MLNEAADIPKKPEGPSDKQIVQQLAEDVALHGWKVRRYTTSQDVDKKEKTLTVTLWRSTASGEQQNLTLVPERPKRGGKKPETPAADAGAEAGGEGSAEE